MLMNKSSCALQLATSCSSEWDGSGDGDFVAVCFFIIIIIIIPVVRSFADHNSEEIRSSSLYHPTS